jgi:putative salt-induced outer membrane protein YdiY
MWRRRAAPLHLPMKSFVIIAALAAAHGYAAADTLDPVNANGWNTSAELGAISTSGNTVGTSVTGKIDAKQETAKWSNEYILAGYFKDEEVTNDDGEKVRERSAQRYSVSAKAGYKLLHDDHGKLFALATHVDDRFGAYTRYSTIGIGYGTQTYQSDTHTLDVEIGPGYFRGVRTEGNVQTVENGGTIRGAALLKWKLSDSAQFSQNLIVERGTDNTHSIAETAVRTKINSTMQMKAAFNVRNDTNVPADKKNTDTQTSVTLVYSF